MKLGATFPQTEMPADPGAVRAYAQAVEDLGFDYILAYDHVIGAEIASRPDWRPLRGGPPAYVHTDTFHEPFVLFSYLSAVTETIGFATGVLILGQRQAALVAKQAAEVDVLSGGRLRLGIGTGWNDVEYEALGMNFRDRGLRSEEQIALMRALWTQDVVNFDGEWHTVVAAGINPLPVQRPIPVWLGGQARALLERVGRIGDGWYLNLLPKDAEPAIEVVRNAAVKAGRDFAAIGIEASAHLGKRDPEDCAAHAATWSKIGATHVTFNTMQAGLIGVDAHIDALRRYRNAVE